MMFFMLQLQCKHNIEGGTYEGMRKLVAVLVVVCTLATMLSSISMEEYEASEKVSSELLEVLGVTYDELT